MGFDYPDGFKNIVIMGGSYGGLRAARVLAEKLVDRHDYRIIVIDRNSHMNHLYVLPRYSILPNHEPKAFIPYTRIFRHGEHRHMIIQATIRSMTRNSVTVSYPLPSSPGDLSGPSAAALDEGGVQVIPFEFAIYALGASLPQPINVWQCIEPTVSTDSDSTDHGPKTPEGNFDGSKLPSISWLKAAQARVQKSESVIVVGGGALGIQIASDIAAVHPTKRVTLIHSRKQLLPIYPLELHERVMEFLSKLGVSVVLDSRLSWESMQQDIRDEQNQRILTTVSGEEYRADTVFICTGAKPNVDILSQGLGEDCINPENGLVRVARTLQVDWPQVNAGQEGVEHEENAEKPPFSHMFAIGDSADAFGAIKAGHTAYFQGDIAALNIAALITKGETAALEKYTPGPPMIKVSVGLKNHVTQSQTSIYAGDDGKEDLGAGLMWKMLGHEIQNEADYDL